MKPANRDPSGLRNDRRSAVSLAWDSWRWRGKSLMGISLGQDGYAEDHEYFGDLANI